MIDTIFNEELEQMKIIINTKNIMQNISYKLSHDMNSIYFFDNLVKNISEYENMERMRRYHFINDVKEMHKVLSYFYKTLQADSRIKERTSAELAKCCNEFPDNIGKRMIIQLSHLPLLDLFHEKLKYEEYFKKKFDLEKVMMGQTILEDQQDKLFGNGLFSKKFPNDDDFIDYKLRNKFVTKLENDYAENRKDILENAISILLNQYKKAEDIEGLKLQIGSMYWDNKKDFQTKQMKTFKSAIEGIFNGIQEIDDYDNSSMTKENTL